MKKSPSRLWGNRATTQLSWLLAPPAPSSRAVHSRLWNLSKTTILFYLDIICLRAVRQEGARLWYVNYNQPMNGEAEEGALYSEKNKLETLQVSSSSSLAQWSSLKYSRGVKKTATKSNIGLIVTASNRSGSSREVHLFFFSRAFHSRLAPAQLSFLPELQQTENR